MRGLKACEIALLCKYSRTEAQSFSEHKECKDLISAVCFQHFLDLNIYVFCIFWLNSDLNVKTGVSVFVKNEDREKAVVNSASLKAVTTFRMQQVLF